MNNEKPPIIKPSVIEPKPVKPPTIHKELIFIGALLGAAYGLIARFVFGLHFSDFFVVMSLAFILGVPCALGFLTAWYGEKLHPKKWWLIWGVIPWASCLAFILLAYLMQWEGLICIIIWLPILLVCSSIGGFFGFICLKIIKAKRNRNYCIAIVALLPFAVAPLEQLRTAPEEIRTVQTQIKIHASPQTVWNQIKTVPLITPQERSFSVSHFIGFPQPLEAKLVGEGIGAVRYATFEKGVMFVETINEWDAPHRLSFSIRADTENIPPKTFDEHVTIGGRHFDVLSGTYRIEDLGNGDVILHLSSNQRLSTRFNFYSHFWTEYLMADLQNYILGIIKKRCEQRV